MRGQTRDLIQRYVYTFGVWEPGISAWIAQHLRPGDVVIDVGANVGYVSLLSAKAVGPTGTVVAFEPVPAIVEQLRRNVALNQLDNVTIVPKVAGESPGETEIFLGDPVNIGLSSTKFGGGHTRSQGMVEVTTGQAAIPPALWSRVRLLKIDTEGDELAVLQGMKSVLTAMPAGSAVLVEITPHALADRGVTPMEVVSLLTELRFTAFVIANPYDAVAYLGSSANAPELAALPAEIVDPLDAIFVKQAH